MLNKNIKFSNFILKKKNQQVKTISNILKSLINDRSELISSLGKSYKDSYSKKFINKFKQKKRNFLNWNGGIYSWC